MTQAATHQLPYMLPNMIIYLFLTMQFWTCSKPVCLYDKKMSMFCRWKIFLRAKSQTMYTSRQITDKCISHVKSWWWCLQRSCFFTITISFSKNVRGEAVVGSCRQWLTVVQLSPVAAIQAFINVAQLFCTLAFREQNLIHRHQFD